MVMHRPRRKTNPGPLLHPTAELFLTALPSPADTSAFMMQPVILCGGSGTRLWPLSRSQHPKQFLSFSDDGQTLLQQTALRLEGIAPETPCNLQPIVVCNAQHRFLAAQQLQDAGVTGAAIILEPAGRGTAPALALAALSAPPQAILLAMPADHAMATPAGFHRAVRAAWALAQDGAMVTFGVVPTGPETGFGYIRKGRQAPGSPAFQIRAFAEKPVAETAAQYVQSGQYLWNAGIFMVRAREWLDLLASLQPDMLAACRQAMASCNQDLDFVRPNAIAFEASPANSIDRAVMEHLPGRADLPTRPMVVPLNAGWSDLGTWDAIWHHLPRDERGNAVVGPALASQSDGNLIVAQSGLVAALGVEGLLIVRTPDATLVAPMDRAQDVRKLVDQVQQQTPRLAAQHRKVYRPWGWYDRIDGGERFQVKRIVVNPGAAISMQLHHQRAEHWVVVRGVAEVTNGDQTLRLQANESTYIPVGRKHQLANPGPDPLEVIEVQSGSYLGEDDIVRFGVGPHYA